jgi:hypothetical protein
LQFFSFSRLYYICPTSPIPLEFIALIFRLKYTVCVALCFSEFFIVHFIFCLILWTLFSDILY